ncbi:hypothetical protein [Ferroplasma acidarmanus]|uniref:Uncharacterized protein n=1 Tax=Ferroplasma acidarmanus Fer1 TaxID=333146 RepID=S0AU48_FERAC|nr:hypothetical protein [Ferroplasma acidarmanus]AGO61905.1 hypothetical protein FACI_IFERC00001G1929 [Ferroplasma acidarmanus Fer1]
MKMLEGNTTTFEDKKIRKKTDDIVKELLETKEVISTTKKPKHNVDYLVGEYNGKLIYTYAKK